MLELIRNLKREGHGIIFSTHHPDHALAVATHAALLRDGTLQAVGPVDAVLTADRLSALFDVELTVVDAAGARICVATKQNRSDA